MREAEPEPVDLAQGNFKVGVAHDATDFPALDRSRQLAER
jgi:hypothetical protein